MPGTFAHFVLVHEASAALKKSFRQVKIAVNKFGRFTLLGANSPDFPLSGAVNPAGLPAKPPPATRSSTPLQ